MTGMTTYTIVEAMDPKRFCDLLEEKEAEGYEIAGDLKITPATGVIFWYSMLMEKDKELI